MLSSFALLAAGLLAGREDAPPRLVVLAPAAWSELLAPYLAARASTHTVEFAALEDLLATEAGDDPPERIKRWLHRAWRERGARFALLVGDADTFPVRFMVLDRCTAAAANYAFYASDLYYADLAESDGSFDDWNAEREGFHARYFGEVRGECTKDTRIDFDRVSYAPELALGRWPVSSAEELAAVLAKTLAWQPVEHAPRALLVHADGWVDERARLGELAQALERGGFAVERQFYGPAAAGAQAEPNPASVLAGLQRGAQLALHLGHGAPDGWHGCLGPAQFGALGELAGGVFVSVGCSTNRFVCEPPYEAYLDEHGVPHRGTNAGEVFAAPPPPPHWLQPGRYDSAGLGELLLLAPRGGALAYIGCSTGAQPCAVTLAEGLTRALAAAPGTTLGEAWQAALAHFARAEQLAELVPDAGWYPPSRFFQGMKFQLFGDPTLRLARP